MKIEFNKKYSYQIDKSKILLIPSGVEDSKIFLNQKFDISCESRISSCTCTTIYDFIFKYHIIVKYILD